MLKSASLYSEVESRGRARPQLLRVEQTRSELSWPIGLLLISVVDVVGVDGLPPPLPRSESVFVAVWAAGADVAAVYGASSRWSKDLFVADCDAVLYHGSFFADLAMRLRELAKACRAQGCVVFAPGALIRHIKPHGIMVDEIPPWFEPAETPLFAAACIKSGQVKFCRRRLKRWRCTPWARR